jgi:hypothetical protein
MPTSNEQTTVRVTDLAERIVDEISEADQDWRAIERRVRELGELVAQLAASMNRPLGLTVRSPRS